MSFSSESPEKLPTVEDILASIRDSTALWPELMRLGNQYCDAIQVTNDASTAFAKGLRAAARRASPLACGDIVKEIDSIATVFERFAGNMAKFQSVFLTQLIAPLQATMDEEPQVLGKWEKEYQKDMEKMTTSLKKAEEKSKSTGKREGDGSTEALKESIAKLARKVKEMEQEKQVKLQEILVIERCKYCFLLGQVCEVLRIKQKVHEVAGSWFKKGLQRWDKVAEIRRQLPPATMTRFVVKERTLREIRHEDARGESHAESLYSTRKGTALIEETNPIGGGHHPHHQQQQQQHRAGGEIAGRFDMPDSMRPPAHSQAPTMHQKHTHEAYRQEQQQPVVAQKPYRGPPGSNAVPMPGRAELQQAPQPPMSTRSVVMSPSSGMPPPALPPARHTHVTHAGGQQVRPTPSPHTPGNRRTGVGAPPVAQPPSDRHYVIALYNNSAEDPQELSFRKGDMIEVTKVINDEWWVGFCDGRAGLFPSNYVTERNH